MMRRTKVIVLQHPNEFRKKHTSTVPLLKMVLGDENIKIKVGYEFTKEDIGLSDGDDVRSRPIMLFPGPEALDLDKYVENRQQQQSRQPQQSIDAVDDETKSDGNNILPPSESDEKAREKYTLVLIDGTWSEAKRIIRKSPEILEGCQMVQFAFADALDEKGEISNPVDDIASPQSSWPTTPESDSDKATKSRSIYHAMRREPEEHCLSTLEACGEALRILEGATHGPRLQTALKAVLSKHVELHLKNAREASKSRHNRDTTSRNSKIRRSKEIEQAIYGGTNVGGNTTTYNSHPSDSIVSPYGGGAVPPTMIAGTPTRRLALDSHTSVTIRRLTHEDIPVIDAWWENGGTPKSTMTITRSIDADYRLGIGASLGIVDESTGALVACILRYESGPLGILHVSEEHRRKGYGTALLREATEAVSRARSELDLPLECSAFIKDGNAASEKVFERVGYVRENPNAKRGTGKRRANRKWIVPSLPTEERR
jgi:DTW domain-containing protein YfiP/GNAT superfamily N-acetyltransferase